MVQETIVQNNKYLCKLERYAVFAYLFGMLGIFPLYFRNQYEKIGDVKFEIFFKSSLIFLTIIIFLNILKFLFRICNGKRNKYPLLQTVDKIIREKGNQFSILDKAVFLYGICIVLSFCLSDFKEFALKGAGGWEMGLYSQLIFIVLYFVLSRQKDFVKSILGIHLLSSGTVFLLGILHRFQIDPLGMYDGLTILQKKEFLSTLGQATWFSSYVCVSFAIGLVLFYLSEKFWIRCLTGVYTILSFAIIVTQNSDSAYVALAGILLVLGYFSLSCMKKWVRFLELLTFMWGTFAEIGILQNVFADRIVPLDSLSMFFSQSIVTWIFFAVSLFFYLIFGRIEESKSQKVMEKVSLFYKIFLGLLAAAMVILVVFIYCNTKGYFLSWWGFQSTNHYLLFDTHWGNNRGLTWMIAWREFWNMPFKNKIFGVGPDCFSAYLYSIPEVESVMKDFWGNVLLTNAHNEYLNSLICYGIFGVLSWIAVLAAGVSRFFQTGKKNPFMIAFALGIVGYMCHNIFCYQQVCCTPFLFILMGIGESLVDKPGKIPYYQV